MADHPAEFMDIKQAAAYCERSVATIRHHIYRRKDLVPDGSFGGSFVFTKATLDAFKQRRSRPGRPTKAAAPETPQEPPPPTE